MRELRIIALVCVCITLTVNVKCDAGEPSVSEVAVDAEGPGARSEDEGKDGKAVVTGKIERQFIVS